MSLTRQEQLLVARAVRLRLDDDGVAQLVAPLQEHRRHLVLEALAAVGKAQSRAPRRRRTATLKPLRRR